MTARKIVGIAALILTIGLITPLLFILNSGAGTINLFGWIAIVLLLVLWTTAYITLIDPGLRRVIGNAFGVTIQWRGLGNSVSWTATEKTGCLVTLVIDVLGYLFIALWFVPLAAFVFIFWIKQS